MIESEEEQETPESNSEGAVPVSRRGTGSLRIEQVQREWSDTSSDVTVKSECWLPQTVERRTDILFQGIQEVNLR